MQCSMHLDYYRYHYQPLLTHRVFIGGKSYVAFCQRRIIIMNKAINQSMVLSSTKLALPISRPHNYKEFHSIPGGFTTLSQRKLHRCAAATYITAGPFLMVLAQQMCDKFIYALFQSLPPFSLLILYHIDCNNKYTAVTSN